MRRDFNARSIVCSGVSLSLLSLLQATHANALFQQSSLDPSRWFGSMWSSWSSRRSGAFVVPQYQHPVPHWSTNASHISWDDSTGRCLYIRSGNVGICNGH